MASSSSPLLLLISLLAVLPILSSARPCKTLFFAYTISPENIQIATTSSPDDVDPTPARFFSLHRVTSPFPRFIPPGDVDHLFPRLVTPGDVDRHHQNRHFLPAEEEEEGLFGMSASSLQERARDILVVVVALLFGVGCGAIAAATMYLAWSLLTNQYHSIGSNDEDEERASPKKMGYHKIVDEPAATGPAVSAKEGYEG